MGKSIKLSPDSVRAAGKAISAISFAPVVFDEEVLSETGGLTSYRLKKMMDDMNRVGSLLTQILQETEKKLDAVAQEMEAADQTAAGQYKK